ncbi:hypothetical protein [uncultured Clostridium sp.]|jgi:hypothetical protein|nr:hypothetical protein [uncultured Clostridium sp.]
MAKNKNKKSKFSNLGEFIKGDSNQLKQNIDNKNTFEEQFNNTKNRFL